MVVYDGVSKAKVRGGKDVTEPQGYAVAFQALVDLIHSESAHEDMTRAVRTTTHAYPKKAIREILGNALVHQDFNERGTGVTVDIYDDRIEVTNPGLPVLPPYQCRLGTRHTTVILAGYKALKNLAPDERSHAVYQHCCLRYVNSQTTSNESVRERFKIEKQNAATASRLLAEAVATTKIRPVDASAANKLMRYVPYWA